MFGKKKNTNEFNKVKFKEFSDSAKYQYILKTRKYIYFIIISKEVHYSEECFVAHNEVTGEIDIVKFCDIISVIVDGKETTF
ncbi:MAG: hypothetical protein A2046_16750 [Bacteroidetes bacterium GWA2_30_7]|nr:MAG: hypothetical protein A2046_16750 [Bacteroidetes bacterium GWA2_30_7]